MARIAFFASALLGVGTLTEARQKAVNKQVHALPKAMTESLSKIAGRFLSKSEINALVDMSSPQSRFLEGIDAMQKEIIKECRAETDTFNQWLQSKQDDLNNNNLQLQALVGHQSDIQNTIDLLQGELSGSEQEQNDLQAQLDGAQNDLQSYQQQLQDAIDLREKSHNQNEAIIKQHHESLQILQGLRDLVAKFDVSEQVMSKQLAKVSKANFLHKKHASKINALITSVKAKLAEAMNKDPQEKQKIKDQALRMIDVIMNGIQDSLNLYKSQEDVLQQKFENEIKPSLEQMISQTQDHISSLQSQLGQVIADHGSIKSDLEQNNDDLAQTGSQISTLQGLMNSLQDQVQEGTDAHDKKQNRCKADLDALEEIRQYVVAHTDGATPGNNCHPESPTCPRCLYDAHCSNGQICLDIGMCGVAPTTAPPQRSYYALITEVVPQMQGRRVDVGVVPQEAFSDNDFTYIFKYQQMQNTDNGWGNVFNVVDNGDEWPFPNQAALFLTGDMFEIDVCDDSKTWGESYWYRNFYRDPVQIGQWNAIAFIVSSSTNTVSFVHRDSAGKVKSQDFPDFHGNPQKFPQTGIYVNGRSYNSLNANFDDFRRYDRALNEGEIEAVFSEFFP